MPGPMGGPRGGQTLEKAKDFKGTTKKLIKNYLSKYKIGFTSSVVSGSIIDIGLFKLGVYLNSLNSVSCSE